MLNYRTIQFKNHIINLQKIITEFQSKVDIFFSFAEHCRAVVR